MIEAAMAAIRPWDGAVVLDADSGTGFHLPRFAKSAVQVIGVEPHPPLLAMARRRTAGNPRVEVRVGTAFVIDDDATRSTFRFLVPPGPARVRPRRGGTVLLAAQLLAEHPGTTVDNAVNLFHRLF